MKTSTGFRLCIPSVVSWSVHLCSGVKCSDRTKPLDRIKSIANSKKCGKYISSSLLDPRSSLADVPPVLKHRDATCNTLRSRPRRRILICDNPQRQCLTPHGTGLQASSIHLVRGSRLSRPESAMPMYPKLSESYSYGSKEYHSR